METPRTIVNGDVEIVIYEQGNPDGDTIILCHGWPDSHHLWDKVVPFLTNRFHVVTIDNRWIGNMSNLDPTEITLSLLADDYEAVISELSPDKPVHIMGHDWGSAAAWELVTRPGAEQRVASFSAVAGLSRGHLVEWGRSRISRPTPKNLMQVFAQVFVVSYMYLMMIPVVPEFVLRIAVTERRWRFAIGMLERVSPSEISLSPTFLEDMISGIAIYRSTMSTNPLRAVGRPTTVPVQNIVGTLEPVMLRPAYADEAKWVDQTWLRVMKGSHWLPFSQPRQLATAATELADAVNGGPPSAELARSRMTYRHATR
ncbi:alpha/beta fold hydrolase [Gordonia sp. CPCC 205333]|uniref:alpha/beta fold hydrolase n=1 Tax=Gordonia sp. CPCC 205333 TaxID=3140790 RepID=UPI003AF3A098